MTEYLDLDDAGLLHITPDVFATECTAVLGKRGSGKSNSVARLLEQAMAHGVTASIIDPHNEHAGLRERFPVYIAGKGEIPVEPQHGAILARWVYANNASVILAIKHFSGEERQRFLLAYVQTLKQLHMDNRRAHLLVVEEAHNFIPQVGSSPLKHELSIVAVEGRKFGLGMLISDQRSATIDKTVLSQAGILLLHRVTGLSDLNVYQDIADIPDAKRIARKLRIGEAIAILNYDVDADPQTVQIKERDTSHGGDTPTLAGTFGAITQDSLGSLAKLLAAHTEDEESEQAKAIRRLTQQVKERDETIAGLRDLVVRQQERIDLISTLKVQMEGNGTVRTELPASLEVDQIHTGQIVTGKAESLNRRESEPVSIPKATSMRPDVQTVHSKPGLHASIQDNAQHLNEHAQKLQRRAFDNLLNAVRSAERYQVFVMKALIAREGHIMSAWELSALTGYQSATITASGLGKLTRLGLVETLRGKGYRSKVRQTLHAQFPALDTDSLIKELLEIRR